MKSRQGRLLLSGVIFAWPPERQFDFTVLDTGDGEEPSLCGKMVSFEPQAHEIGTGGRIDCEELD